MLQGIYRTGGQPPDLIYYSETSVVKKDRFCEPLTYPGIGSRAGLPFPEYFYALI